MRSVKFLFFPIFICFLSILFASSGFSANYYVQNGGNDNASGLNDNNAWATIAKINKFARANGFQSGDTINLKRGSIWSNDEPLGWKIYPYQWGTINGLTIRDYGVGPLPRLNCNTQQAIIISSPRISNLVIMNIDISGFDWSDVGNFPNDANLRIEGVNGVVFDGIYCDGHKGSITIKNKNSTPKHQAISLSSIEGDIEVKNCKISNMMKDTLNNSVAAWGTGGPTGLVIWYRPSHDIPKTNGTVLIHDNVIRRIYADCIQTGGIRTTTKIYNNKLGHFGENAIDVKAAKFFDIHHNEFFWEDFGSSPGVGFFGASAIIAGDSSNYWPSYRPTDITIRDNYFHDISTRCISVSWPDWKIYRNYFKDIGMGVYIGSQGAEVHNNLFELTEPFLDHPPFSTTPILRSGIYFTSSPYTRENMVYNNTIYVSSPNHQYGIATQTVTGQHGNQIKDNVIYLTRNNSNVFPLYLLDKDDSNTYPFVKNKCLYNLNSSNRALWDGITYTYDDLSKFVKNVGAGAIFADPLFVDEDNGNFSLLPNSPCIINGVNLGVKLPLPIHKPEALPPPTDLMLID